MKKTLTKKVKKTSNAIHYFSGENLTTKIVTHHVDPHTLARKAMWWGSCPC